MQAESNLFRAGKFRQIPYRVFISSSNTSNPLYVAECRIRRSYSQPLVSIVGNELWVFSLSSSLPPSVTGEILGLTETSTGVFLSSTIASHSRISQLPTPYVPFITSVKALLFNSLCSQYLFVPLGPVVINLSTGNVLHVEPALLPLGDLVFRIYYQRSTLLRFSPKVIPSSPLYISPIGVPAEFVSFASSPPNASSFLHILETTFGVKFQPSSSFLKVWGEFRLLTKNPINVIWPTDLCFYYNVMAEKDIIDYLLWFKSSDVISRVESQMNDLQSLLMAESVLYSNPPFSQSNTHHQSQTSQRQIPAPNSKQNSSIYPTPPDPIKLNRLDNNDQESNWATPGVVSDTWGDDDLFGDGDEQEVTEADFNFFDDHKQVNDDFFMLDHQSDHNDDLSLNIQPQSSSQFSPPDKKQKVSAFEFQKIQVERPDFKHYHKPRTIDPFSFDHIVKSEQLHIDNFSPLQFDSSISDQLDSKYAQGGRYYVKPEIVNEYDLSSESDDDQSVSHDTPYSTTDYTPHEDKPKTMVNTTNPSLENPTQHPEVSPIVDDESHIIAKQHVSSWLSSFSLSSIIDSFAVPSLSSSPSMSPNLSITPLSKLDLLWNGFQDSSLFDSTIDQIVQQTVWDDGLFSSVIPETQQFLYPDNSFANCLQALTPQIKGLTLNQVLHLAQDSECDDASPESPSEKKYAAEPLQGSKSASDVVNHSNTDFSSSEMAKSISTDSYEASDDMIFWLPPPRYTLFRMSQLLQAQPTLLRLWKVFGLAPRSGVKDITVVSVVPNSSNVVKSCQHFVEILKNTYEGCNLGTFDFLNFNSNHTFSSVDSGNAVIPVSYIGNSIDHALECMKSAIISLARDLKSINIELRSKNLVIIILNPVPEASAIASLAKAFAVLKKTYLDEDSQLRTENSNGYSVTLKILPIDLVVSPDTLNMPSQYRMVSLALNIYDSCLSDGKPGIGLNSKGSDSDSTELMSNSKSGYSDEGSPSTFNPHNSYRRSPAFELSKMPPPHINYEFSRNPSSSMLFENIHMHVAYSISLDKRWVVVSWGDELGKITKVEAIHMLKPMNNGDSKSKKQKQSKLNPHLSQNLAISLNNLQLKSWEEVSSYIWNTTLDLISQVPVHWQITIAKVVTNDNSHNRPVLPTSLSFESESDIQNPQQRQQHLQYINNYNAVSNLNTKLDFIKVNSTSLTQDEVQQWIVLAKSCNSASSNEVEDSSMSLGSAGFSGINISSTGLSDYVGKVKKLSVLGVDINPTLIIRGFDKDETLKKYAEPMKPKSSDTNTSDSSFQYSLVDTQNYIYAIIPHDLYHIANNKDVLKPTSSVSNPSSSPLATAEKVNASSLPASSLSSPATGLRHDKSNETIDSPASPSSSASSRPVPAISSVSTLSSLSSLASLSSLLRATSGTSDQVDLDGCNIASSSFSTSAASAKLSALRDAVTAFLVKSSNSQDVSSSSLEDDENLTRGQKLVQVTLHKSIATMESNNDSFSDFSQLREDQLGQSRRNWTNSLNSKMRHSPSKISSEPESHHPLNPMSSLSSQILPGNLSSSISSVGNGNNKNHNKTDSATWSGIEGSAATSEYQGEDNAGNTKTPSSATEPAMIQDMKTILGQYRTLASLGEVTGVVQKKDCVIPWHIEAVEKVKKMLMELS